MAEGNESTCSSRLLVGREAVRRKDADRRSCGSPVCYTAATMRHEKMNERLSE